MKRPPAAPLVFLLLPFLQPPLSFRQIALVALLVPSLLLADPPPDAILSPCGITSTHMQGDARDPQKAKALLLQWLEAKRDSEEYEDNHDSNYARAADIIRAADGDDAVDAFLKQELALTKSRRSRYAILQQLAERREREKKYEKAISLWMEARESVMSGTHAYYTTRQAEPLLKAGQLFLLLGRKDKARECFEEYCSSDYGKEEANGVFVLLGDLYEESGEWDKARALYEHYAGSGYYRNSKELQRRLALPTPQTLEPAREHLIGLRDPEPAKRRRARNALYLLISSSGEPSPWIRWLERAAAEEPDRHAQDEIGVLLPLITPLAEIGGPSAAGAASERIKQMKADRERYRAYEELLETLFSRNAGNEYRDARQVMVGVPYTLAGLSTSADFRVAMERVYSQVRELVLHPEAENPLKEKLPLLPAQSASNGVAAILQEIPTFRDYLRKCVSLQTPHLGYACLFLYALGIEEDVDFIIDNIPEDQLTRNQMLLGLAAALHRERIVDIPAVLGVDKRHVHDWWNIEMPGDSVQRAFRAWRDRTRDTFSYGQVLSSGRRVFDASFVGKITSIVQAPELDGIFFFEEGGFLDYSGNVCFFSFRTGQCCSLMGGAPDSVSNHCSLATSGWRQSGNRVSRLANLSWNPDAMRCEFDISRAKRIGIPFTEGGDCAGDIEELPMLSAALPGTNRLGHGVQQYKDLTFEIRSGDLFVVDETTGKEECIESFGYVLSFTPNRDGTKILALSREIIGVSLNLHDTSDKLGSLALRRERD